jgi:hypothetical protein
LGYGDFEPEKNEVSKKLKEVRMLAETLCKPIISSEYKRIRQAYYS